MKQRTAWQRFALTALLFWSAGISWAAVQGRDPVYWLGTDDWQLREQGGEVYLVQSSWDMSDRLPKVNRHEWRVSTPTITGPSGKFLGSDPEGRTPSVHLVPEKGANTRWVFEFVTNLSPGPSREERRMKEGPAGYRFRARMAEGPFKDWYLAAEEPPCEAKERKGNEPAARRLKLVRNVKEATVFTYIEVNYFVDHK
jgi:hypothetical protein